MSFRALPIVLFAGAACGDPEADSETSHFGDEYDRAATYDFEMVRQ